MYMAVGCYAKSQILLEKQYQKEPYYRNVYIAS